MTGVGTPPGQVRCPICLNLLTWSTAPLFLRDGTSWLPLPARTDEDDIRWSFLMTGAYRACRGRLGPVAPGAAPGGTTHYLPERFGAPGVEPLVVGLVGETASGKTHLLAAMVHMLIGSHIRERLGLQIEPLEQDLHEQFMATFVRPFIDRSERLRPTREDNQTQFADAFLVHDVRSGRRFALAFFDVAGESIASDRQATAFFQVVDALIFVVDPESIAGLGRVSETAATRGGRVGDRTFDRVLALLPEHLSRWDGRFRFLPASVVVAKADLFVLRDDRVERWLYQHGGDDLAFSDADQRAEDEDAYLFLTVAEGQSWLRPFEVCVPSSLHFASASGGDIPDDVDRYPRAVTPGRVLRPLLSLFRMTGVLDDDTPGGLP